MRSLLQYALNAANQPGEQQLIQSKCFSSVQIHEPTFWILLISACGNWVLVHDRGSSLFSGCAALPGNC